MCIVLTSLVAMSGDIVALGDGRVGGNVQDFNLEVGQTVVYSKFGIGSTDLDIQGQRHTMLREDDCIGIMPRSGATASDIPELRPVGDRVLLKVSTSAATAVVTASVHIHTSVLCLKVTTLACCNLQCHNRVLFCSLHRKSVDIHIQGINAVLVSGTNSQVSGCMSRFRRKPQ